MDLIFSSQTAVDIYLTLAKAAECRYPELLRKVFVINGTVCLLINLTLASIYIPILTH